MYILFDFNFIPSVFGLKEGCYIFPIAGLPLILFQIIDTFVSELGHY